MAQLHFTFLINLDMDERKIKACFTVKLWYLNIVTWLMMWFMMNHNSARRRNRQLALRNRTFVRRMMLRDDGRVKLDGVVTMEEQNCLGALDGTYINVHVPERDKPRYRSRKGEIATNMLGVCNLDMNFIFVYPSWEGSASDSRVLRDAISRPSGLKVPTGCYYLVDGGYTKKDLLIFFSLVLSGSIPNTV
ncbi:unnamed protein product [Malus baccata var. baccata]